MSWLDNPYRTIIQMCQIKLLNENKTVYDTLTDMLVQLGDGNVDNPVADKRISKAVGMLTSAFPASILNDSSFIIQTGLITFLKTELKDD